MKLGKEVVTFSDRIMNILVEVFKNKNPVAQVCDAEDSDGVDVSLKLVGRVLWKADGGLYAVQTWTRPVKIHRARIVVQWRRRCCRLDKSALW